MSIKRPTIHINEEGKHSHSKEKHVSGDVKLIKSTENLPLRDDILECDNAVTDLMPSDEVSRKMWDMDEELEE